MGIFRFTIQRFNLLLKVASFKRKQKNKRKREIFIVLNRL